MSLNFLRFTAAILLNLSDDVYNIMLAIANKLEIHKF